MTEEDKDETCIECEGDGWVYDPAEGTIVCPVCDGESAT